MKVSRHASARYAERVLGLTGDAVTPAVRERAERALLRVVSEGEGRLKPNSETEYTLRNMVVKAMNDWILTVIVVGKQRKRLSGVRVK